MNSDSTLPDGWSLRRIGDVAKIVTGRTPPTSTPKFYGGDIPFIKPPHLIDRPIANSEQTISHSGRDETTIVPKNAVLVSCIGNLGKTGLTTRESAFNQQINAAIFDDTVIPRFGFYQCQMFKPILEKLASATTISIVNKSKFSEVPFLVPSHDSQRRIVEKIEELFSDLDAGVAALKRAQANLKRYREAVLKAAVEGRLTEQWRAERKAKAIAIEPAVKLLERILAERRKKWEAAQLKKYADAGKAPPKDWKGKYPEPTVPDSSDMNELPEGWCWASLDQIAFFQNGRAFPSAEYTDAGIKLLRPGNLYVDGTVGWTERNTKCLPERWLREFPDYLVGEDELVMNLTAQSLKDEFLGRTCLTSTAERCLLNQRLARILPVDAAMRRFLLIMFKSKLFRNFVNGLNTGSLIQHMFTSQLDGFGSPLPPTEEQAEIVAQVEAKLSNIAQAETEIKRSLERTARLRQAILKRAFEGGLV